MKSRIIWIAVFIAGLAIFCLLYRPGLLRDLDERIDVVVNRVYESGKDEFIEWDYSIEDSEIVTLMSPPYASLDQYKGELSSDSIERMEWEIGSAETGHLFCLLDGKVMDHRTLSGRAEPILGVKRGRSLRILVSKKETSGRPIRIEFAY